MREQHWMMRSILLAAALCGVATITALAETPDFRATANSGARVTANAGGGTPVDQMSDPRQIDSAALVDNAGQTLGRVVSVRTAPDGRALQVRVELLSPGKSRAAIIRADKLRYEPQKNVVVADVTSAQLNPAAGTGPSFGGAKPFTQPASAHPSSY